MASQPALPTRSNGRGRTILRANTTRFAILLAVVALIVVPGLPLLAAEQDATAARLGPDPQQFEQTVARGVNYLISRGQEDNGSFSSYSGIGVTALATTALLEHGRTPNDPAVARALGYLQGFVQPSGGIHQPDTFHRNYETCLALVCFKAANTDGRYDELIKRADAFIKGAQWDEGEDKEPADVYYGGAGYGSHKRPDLSNTSFLVEALHAVGSGKNDPAIQKALIFVSRCQNLETEHNTTQFASKNPDGGFYYTCANEGESKSGELPNGGLRSYGSMTYAGLKSLIYAGLGADDPRVKAATTWIRKHYTLENNPGMGASGLYYYYHTFAKTLGAMGGDRFEDAAGGQHDWRRELTAQLAKQQQDDGSWINDDARWLEGDPNLVTSYALLALAYCRPVEAR